MSLHRVRFIGVFNSPGARTKKWLILGGSLTHLGERRHLSFLKSETADNIFSVGCAEKYAGDEKLW